MRFERTYALTMVAALVAVGGILTGCAGSGGGSGSADGPSARRAGARGAVASRDGLGDVLGVPTIRLTTRARPASDRPELSWEAVDGAASYQVEVATRTGDPYWAWSGDETSVPLGGARSGAASPGPRVADRMTYEVVAFGPDGAVVAASPKVEVRS